MLLIKCNEPLTRSIRNFTRCQWSVLEMLHLDKWGWNSLQNWTVSRCFSIISFTFPFSNNLFPLSSHMGKIRFPWNSWSTSEGNMLFWQLLWSRFSIWVISVRLWSFTDFDFQFVFSGFLSLRLNAIYMTVIRISPYSIWYYHTVFFSTARIDFLVYHFPNPLLVILWNSTSPFPQPSVNFVYWLTWEFPPIFLLVHMLCCTAAGRFVWWCDWVNKYTRLYVCV